jgi:putative colanic acid biosynthesis acetyltransferase WcaF
MFGWRNYLLRCFGAKIGKNCHVYPDVKIWAPWRLEMDDVACIAGGAEIYNPAGIKIGHHATISQAAYLCGATHDVHHPAFTYIAKPIVLGSYAWVAARAIVLPGVTLGEGAVLGAGAVAARSLAPWSIHAGNPAKLIGYRKHEA